MRSSGIAGTMVAAAMAMAASMGERAPSVQSLGYYRRANGVAKKEEGKNGDKLRGKRGMLGLGMHSTGRMPLGEGTVSPKKDIGKGPARTLSVRDNEILNGRGRVARRASRYTYFKRLNHVMPAPGAME